MNIVLPYGVAIFIRCITLALIALGVVLQRKSHVINDKLPTSEQKNAFKRPLWHLGFWMYVIASLIGDVAGISSLPILVIAPLTTLVMFFNAAYSQCLLNEKMKTVGWIGTVIVALASAVLAILLNLPNTPRNETEMKKLLLRPGYIAYCVVNILLLGVCTVMTWHYLNKRKKLMFRILPGNNGIDIVANLANQKVLNKTNLCIALLYQFTSTILAAQALVFAKLCFDLLVSSMTDGANGFISGLSIGIPIVTGITTILQLVLFNASLHYYTTLVTVPFGYSVGIIFACVNTIIYYDSFFILAPWKVGLVVLSVIVTIGGICLLSKT